MIEPVQPLDEAEQAELAKLERTYRRLNLYAWWRNGTLTGLEDVPTTELQAIAERAIVAAQAGPLTEKQEEFLPRLRTELALRRRNER